MAPEPEGAVTSAECAAPHSGVVRGTIDAKAVSLTYDDGWTTFNQTHQPFHAVISLPSTGSIHFQWEGVCLPTNGLPVPVTGTLRLPYEDTERPIKECSLLWDTYDETAKTGAYRFNIVLENGQLTGCAAWF